MNLVRESGHIGKASEVQPTDWHRTEEAAPLLGARVGLKLRECEA